MTLTLFDVPDDPADLAAALYDDADRKGLIRLDTTTRKAAT